MRRERILVNVVEPVLRRSRPPDEWRLMEIDLHDIWILLSHANHVTSPPIRRAMHR